MTPYQIREILNADRDQDGKLIPDNAVPRPLVTAEERFTWWWVLRCLPRWLIAKKWQKEQSEAGDGAA